MSIKITYQLENGESLGHEFVEPSDFSEEQIGPGKPVNYLKASISAFKLKAEDFQRKTFIIINPRKMSSSNYIVTVKPSDVKS